MYFEGDLVTRTEKEIRDEIKDITEKLANLRPGLQENGVTLTSVDVEKLRLRYETLLMALYWFLGEEKPKR